MPMRITQPFAPAFAAVLFAMIFSAGCTDSHGGDGGTGDSGVTDAARDTGIADTGGGGISDCTAPSDCVVVPVSCCGSCGAATRGDAVAIHVDRRSDHQTIACGGGMAACPACYSPQDPSLIATCNAGTCEVVDLLVDPISECVDGMDCRLRTQSCCECGGDTTMEGLIAIPRTSEEAYMTLVCDDGPMAGCPECAPLYPMEASAVCDATGHCAVVWGGAP